MFDRLEQLEQRYEELGQQLSDPGIVNDQENYRKVSKQHRDLEETVEKFRQYRTLKQGISDAKSMLLENERQPIVVAGLGLRAATRHTACFFAFRRRGRSHHFVDQGHERLLR